MRPYQEKKFSTESIPSDQLNYSLLSNLNANGANITQNTSPISSDTTKDMTVPINPVAISSSQFLADVSILQDQIITEALAAAITQTIMPNISINLQGYPAFDQNTNYEEEYHRAFVMNEIMIKKLAQYCEEINIISERAKRLQEIFEQKLMKVNHSFSAHDLSRPLEPLSQQNLSAFNKPYSQEALSFSNNNFNPKKFQVKNHLGNDENHTLQKKFLTESLTNNNINKIGIQRKVNEDCEDLVSFSELNANSENYTQNEKNRPKKLRRCAADIEKSYECPYEECKKAYGSEVSLNLHIKIKHNGGNKTEREKLAKQMFLAKINGKEVPQASLNLPPGFLEQYKDGLKKVKRCREGPYSSNNLRVSQQNILIHQNSKSDTQIKIE
ncbi:zinc finger, C2H2 type family protein (macronuclear) [Tetrahymena thermophila SB210]|uniref:Zinc finger, C2H2 type family protein n=1 Tax=Tetrahymena thermophila (strain SB210) TaxID=312017 RepID=Q22BF1_TETTS|nr:zinc finger, C2H2 type family protein [Tetrahymena thermophila SB210]EAR82604.2 zinc finger, C2H2 type family protein [Tetrahymena thermophila SB210]|eukprot:XP_001030267.2 zinc finger, C2H2 type family protein [Tetrahymena thermophila SB210]